ncbi:MAG TPA: hypothetical protein VFM34_13015 [Moraxellaceae bacterium]|nr:hypothetical protein [Moraxellaceae bacterium]
MNEPYPFADLGQVNRWVGWLLLPPVVITTVALLQAFYANALLTGLPSDLWLAHLPPLPTRTLHHADALRLTQLALTALFILFFCVCWLFLAFRNLLALTGLAARSARRSIAIHLQIWANLIFAVRMMQRLWRESTPESLVEQAERWLVPWWWAVLIGANVCMAMGILALRHPVSLGEWRHGNYWMLAAYAGYLGQFVLTWRLVKRLEVLQRASWQHRRLVLSAADGAA